MLDKVTAQTFEIKPSPSGTGAEVLGIDLSKPLSDQDFKRLSGAFNDHSVLVYRDQHVSPEDHIAFSRRWGPLQVNVRSDFNKPGYPELYIVSNVVVDGKPIGSQDAGRYWHTDLCYLPKPTKCSLLYAHELPGPGLGDTMFASNVNAYQRLPESVKKRLEGKKAANSYRYMYDRKVSEFGLRPKLTDEEKKKYPDDAIHPVIRTHPETGKKCIFVCEGYTTHILDMPKAESDELLQILFDAVQQPNNVYRHSWKLGDLLMWDNCAVQHKVSFDYQLPLRRRLERTTVEAADIPR
jgi:alpha-ketoglutarate-dependent taurine dioxygenase